MSRTGRGDNAFYQVASAEAAAASAQQENAEAVTNFVWLSICDRQETDRADLVRSLRYFGQSVIDPHNGNGK